MQKRKKVNVEDVQLVDNSKRTVSWGLIANGSLKVAEEGRADSEEDEQMLLEEDKPIVKIREFKLDTMV